METLSSKLSSSLEGPFDLIVYIGAGSSVDLSDFVALNPKRLVLVEGDPAAAERLARSIAVQDRCTILPMLITPNGANCPFYLYNLPFLNGTLPLGNLQTLYPRLRVLETIELPSKTLSSLLETMPITGEGKRLLIVDIPGQETGILGSLPSAQLQAFDWALARGCANPLQEGAQSISASITTMEGSFFKQVVTDDESDPVWPIRLLRLDRRMAELQNESEDRARLLVEKSSWIERQAHRVLELESQLHSAQDDLNVARQQLAELGRSIEAIEAAKALALKEAAAWEAAANAELEIRARFLMEKASEIDRQAKRIVDLESQVTAGHGELEGARAQLGELSRQLNDQAQQLGSTRDRVASLEADLASQKTLGEVLSQGRQQQDKLCRKQSQELEAARVTIEELKVRIAEAEELLASKETRSNYINNEFQKVEGQIDLIKEIFLRETIR